MFREGFLMFESRKLHSWELALLLSLCFALMTGVWAQGRQTALSEKLVRLHVVAASDTPSDQAEKLRVRDAVLSCLEPKLKTAASAKEAAEIIRLSKEACRRAAETVTDQRVTITMTREHFPTRSYETFSLPAGEYLALRVTLGAGEGHNWWCVLFPPLCTEAVTSDRAVETLSRDDVQLITEDGKGSILRFRVLELWDAVKSYLTAPPS